VNPRGILFRLFPPPAYILRRSAGIDISDRSVKVMTLVHHYGNESHGVYGEEALTPGTVEGGKVRDSAALTAAIKKLKDNLHLSAVSLSLPEEEAFLFTLSLPPMKEKEIRESILLQLENHIPIPATETAFDYDIVAEKPRVAGGREVSVSAIARAHVQSYTQAVIDAGLTPLALEVESHSLCRSVVPAEERGTVLVIDFGKTRAGVTVVSGGSVRYTATVPNVGGEDITKALEKELKVSREEAEKLKVTHGLSRKGENKAVFSALIALVSVLKDELVRHVGYWNTRVERGEILGGPITRAYLAGGQATLPGLAEYLSAHLGIAVSLGNPWVNVASVEEVLPDITRNDALRYATSIGLALRSIRPDLL